VQVADYRLTPEEMLQHGLWRWCTLKQRARTLAEAKKLAQDFLNRHPDFLHPLPPENEDD